MRPFSTFRVASDQFLPPSISRRSKVDEQELVLSSGDLENGGQSLCFVNSASPKLDHDASYPVVT